MKLFRFGLLFLAISLSTTSSFGQGRQGGAGGFGGGTSFGGGGGGANSFGGFRSGGGGGFGGGGLTGGGFGSGGMGGGFGSGGFAGGGMGGQSGSYASQMGQFGNFGNNQSFVGSSGDDVRQMFERMGANSDQMVQQLERANNRRERRDQNNARENQAPPVRVQLKVAFDHPTIATTTMPAVVTRRFTQIVSTTNKQLATPGIEVRDGVVTLTGIAASASDRLLIEKLVSLEPGVKRVQNQMTVAEEIAVPTPPQ